MIIETIGGIRINLLLTAAEGSRETLNQVTIVLWLLIAVTVVAVLTKYIRLPYVIALVLAGLVIALTPGIPTVTLTPDLIVVVFLPALLFEAAYNLSFEQLRQNVRFISALALWGVLGTVAIVAGLLIWLVGLPWETALIFGAIVGATDPVSVVATFRKLGISHRLTVLIEGESLFNDGSALVIFNLLVGIVVAGKFSVWESLSQFVIVAAGGLALGLIIGYFALALLSTLNDYLTEILVTIVVAYGTFLAAEQIGVSPALAVVAAGLLVGNFGQEKAMSATSRAAVGLSWEFFGYLANSLIFLLVGLEVRAIDFSPYWGMIGLGIGATLISRILVIAFFSNLSNFISGRPLIPFNWQILLVWGGLRGALSLALALSLPVVLSNGNPFPDRDKLLVMTFGLILFSLLVQGLTIQPLTKLLGLGPQSNEVIEKYEILNGKLSIIRTSRQKIQELVSQDSLSAEVAEKLVEEYNQRENSLSNEFQELEMPGELLMEEQLLSCRRQLFQLEKNSARELHSQGVLSARSLKVIWEEIDNRIAGNEESEKYGNVKEFKGNEPLS